MTHASPLWLLRPRSPWGDYGRILVHGMSSRLARVDGKFQLKRVGPFVPPVSLPAGAVIVTGEMRALLERECISGVAFRAVDAAHVVAWNWPEWDKDAELPQVLPESGEPEDYLLAHPHDPQTALELGELWQLVPHVGGVVTRQQISVKPRSYRYAVRPDTHPGVDVFQPRETHPAFVSERLRELLTPVAGSFLQFEAVIVGELPPPPPLELYYLHEATDPVPDGYEVTKTIASPFDGKIMRVATPIVKLPALTESAKPRD